MSEKMNILLICDDLWHPAEVIERGLRAFGEKLAAYHIDIVKDAKDILTPEMLKHYRVVINAKANQLNGSNTTPWFEAGVAEVMPSDFEAYVREGGGFLSLHAGNMPKDDSGYAEFVGNYFVNHPPRCAVTYVPTKEHAVTKGVETFTERDEHYHLDGFADDMEVFLVSRSESGGERIAGYSRLMGEGRLCMLVPGHHIKVWENENFQTLLINAINWCAKVTD